MNLPQFLDPKNDVAFKKLFGTEEHKEILIHFINDIFFKYAKVTENADFKRISQNDKIIEKAFDAIFQFNWTVAEKNAYEAELKRVRDNRAVEEYRINKAKADLEKAKAVGKAEGKAVGKAEGKAEGEKQALYATAKKLLALGVDIQTIAKATTLSSDKIENLKEKIL